MISLGFVAGYSDLAVQNVDLPYVSSYIYISGSSGNIVWENGAGLPQVLINAQAGVLYPIGVKKILSSGTVGGIVYNTTATNIVYLSSAKGV